MRRFSFFPRSLLLGCCLLAELSLSSSAIASAQRGDAVVLVNSSSAKYPDFQHYLQPYLDNFGVPYTVLDIASNAVPPDIGRYALIIVGHAQLDTNQLHLTPAAQSNLVTAVSLGSGLVNFDGALTNGVGTNGYPYLQAIFNFSYAPPTAGNILTFPVTEASNQLHYITVLHQTNTYQSNSAIALAQSMTTPGLTFGSNVTAVVLNSGNPLVTVTKFGLGRAVQFAGYDWMAVAVKGPVFGLDDLVWRSFVWSARKPFLMRGMPNFVTMRIDDADGPFDWTHTAISNGFKPWLGVFYISVSTASANDLRGMVTNGSATTAIHSVGAGGDNWFYFDYNNSTSWSDAVMSNHYAAGTQWHLTNNIPISKVLALHYSELGTNAFAGLQTWGIQYITLKNDPGAIRDSPWLVSGPYRYYEPRQLGSISLPLFYADFLTIAGHPEFNGQFFNVVTEIRDDSPCAEWCPANNDVPGSIGRGVRQLKRAFDSQALATLYTHEWYLHPNPERSDMPAITPSNWAAILSGITNGIAAYQPIYVTLDYACQYVRATRTSHLVTGGLDVASGQVSATLTGAADLGISVDVFTGADATISNTTLSVPSFAGTNTATAAILPPPPPPTLQGRVQGNQLLLSFDAIPWQDYIVAYATNLSPGNWVVLTNVTANGTNVVCSDALSNASQRFYRVLLTSTDPGPLTLTGRAQGSRFGLGFNARAGATYSIQYANGAGGTWSTLTNVIALDTNITIYDPFLNTQRFYRVSTPKN